MSCSVRNCSLPKHQNHDECILHCSKEDALSDYHMNSEDLVCFYENLNNHIIEKIASGSTIISKERLLSYFTSAEEPNTDIDILLENKKIVLSYINFPTRDEHDYWDYEPILNYVGSIHFNYCKFYLPWLDLKKTKCFFQDCEFFDDWQLLNYELLTNIQNVIYQQCTFNKSVSADGSELSGMLTLENSQFNNCVFKENLSFKYVIAKEPIFNDSRRDCIRSITDLKIFKCSLEKRLILNHYSIDTVIFTDSQFKDKFDFTYNKIKSISINNCNFIKLSEFFLSQFLEFNVEKTIFHDYTGFENCQFGYKYLASNIEGISTFKYATFLSFVNFRNTYFFSGLDIDHINLKESPNFLNSNVSEVNTNRETFRLIKNSLDKIGNHIDANRFFVLEMKKYKEELVLYSDKKSEKFVFWCNEFISDFGQNYVKPVILLTISSFLFFLFFLVQEQNILYNISPEINNFLVPIQFYLNKFALTILPVKKLLFEKMEFISLIFYIINSILIWQIIVAIKRHTRR